MQITALLVLVGYLATLVGAVIILVAAFKKSLLQGFLTLLVPFYIIYFVITQYQSEKKKMVVSIWLGGLVLIIIGSIMLGVQGAAL